MGQTPQHALPGKPVSASAIQDQTILIFPNDLNAMGTLFGGRVLELADQVAAVVALRHSGNTCVTAAIDSVRFLAPATHDDLLVFQASANRAWNTSMEVGLKAFAERVRTHERRHIFSAYFTFVALDRDCCPAPIPPVIPQTEAEKRRYIAADVRRQGRLALRRTE